MPNPKLLYAGLLLFASISASAQFTDIINSNRPGESMSAFSVGKTVFQAEFGVYGFEEKYDSPDYKYNGFGTDLMLRYGAFFEQLEFILEAQYQKDNFQAPAIDGRSNIRQALLGAKFLFYDPYKHFERKPNLYSWKANHKFQWRDLIPAVGLYAGVNLNLFNSEYYAPQEEKISPKAMLLTQNQFGRWVLVTNVYADKIITDFMQYGYIVTVTRGFNDRWSAFIENQGIKYPEYIDFIFRGGAAFLIKENIQVDASIGKNVETNPGVLVGGIGLSWRFDANYEDVLLRAPKDEKDDKKKDKKKDKEKKRKDVILEEEKP